MKISVLYFLFLLNISLYAQNTTGGLEEGSFVLRGRVKNAKEIWLAVSHPISNQEFRIPVQQDGRFEKKLPIIGCEDMYLYLHQTIICMVFPGDTIELEYDVRRQTYRLSSPGSERNRELQLDMVLNEGMMVQEKAVVAYYDDLFFQHKGQYPGSDTLFNRAKEYVDAYWKILDDFEIKHGHLPHKKNFQARSFYSLAEKFAGDPVVYNDLFPFCLEDKISDDFFEEFIFYGEHFDPFLHSCVREFCDRAFRTWLRVQLWDITPEGIMKMAQIAIPNPDLFEAFCMRLFYGEGYNRHVPLKQLAPDWLSRQLKNHYFRKELKRMVKELSQFLQPGEMAPDFTLKDQNRKKVSLYDFRGKYIYLDFWNTSCVPCIAEFPYSARLLKENPDFRDKIIFLSVCIGRNEALWKQLLLKHQVQGVCLYTDQLTDQAIIPYKVSAFPHYMLIDPEGRIISPYVLAPAEVINHFAGEANYLERFVNYYLAMRAEENGKRRK